jgi:hypothetical protein
VKRGALRPRTTLVAIVAVACIAASSATAAGLLIGTAQLRTGAVTAPKLGLGAVTTPKLKVRSVNRARLALGSVGTDQLGDGAVGSAKLADGSISAADLATGSVGSAAIADGSITPADIGSGIVRGDVTVESVRASLASNQADAVVYDAGVGSKLRVTCFPDDRSQVRASFTGSANGGDSSAQWDGFHEMTTGPAIVSWSYADANGGTINLGTDSLHSGSVYVQFGSSAQSQRRLLRFDFMVRPQGDADGGCLVLGTVTTLA